MVKNRGACEAEAMKNEDRHPEHLVAMLFSGAIFFAPKLRRRAASQAVRRDKRGAICSGCQLFFIHNASRRAY